MSVYLIFYASLSDMDPNAMFHFFCQEGGGFQFQFQHGFPSGAFQFQFPG